MNGQKIVNYIGFLAICAAIFLCGICAAVWGMDKVISVLGQ
jgi:hypothetical protein